MRHDQGLARRDQRGRGSARHPDGLAAVPNFSYRAFSDAGDLREGQVEAASREAAEEAVWRLGLTPFEWRDGGASRRGFAFGLGESRPSAARLAAFTREFATLEQAEIPLDQS